MPENSAKMDEIEENKIEVDGINLNYTKRGRGKTNLLCTSGTLGTTDDFTVFMNGMDADLYTIVAWDPPGYGKSRPPDRNQAINRAQKDAKLALQLMEKLDLLPFVACGWSEGSRISCNIAHIGSFSKKCSALIIWGAGCRVDQRGVAAFERMSKVDTWTAEQRDPLVEVYGLEYVAQEWKAVSDLITKVFNEQGGLFPSYMALDYCKQPTLILHGDKDLYAEPEHIKERIKHAKVVIKEGGQHRLHLDEPEWFRDQINFFFQEIQNQKQK